MKEFTKDKLAVKIAGTRREMGEAAADAVARQIGVLLENKDTINMIFAAAPSQNEFLAALIQKEIPWNRINAFHMDEYIGLSPEAPQGFGNFLYERIFGKVQFGSVHYLNGNAADSWDECKRYGELLKTYPPDIVCMGIGENTHIAFNDPHAADFNDPYMVKVVDLDEACRQQQVNDGCFATITEVPAHALTLTVPALFQAVYAYCIVPGRKKAQAVKLTLSEDISELYPSTILRKYEHAVLFTDSESSSLLEV